jgi:outer membrane protein TolC
LVPSAVFEHVQGTVRATEGNLVGVSFNTFQPSIAVQWVLNPGKVIYEIIAAKKRLRASEHEERAVQMEALRTAANQYYELVLAQARVAAAHEAVAEAVELLRISRLRGRTGTGVPADELRAEARLAQRQQDLAVAMNAFYEASVSLTVTLHLGDPTITLVPKIDRLPPIVLVRSGLSIDELLAFAVRFRPDLESVRTLVEAAEADRGATWWGAWGPQFQMGYQFGGITGQANNVKKGQGIPGNLIVNPLSPTGSFSSNPLANGLIKEGILRGSRRAGGRDDQTFGFSDQQRFSAGTRWRLSLSAFGDLKTAGASRKRALLEAERLLDLVAAQVVRSQQAGKTLGELITLARRQVASADEALRLTLANLRAGTMTTLDVLQAQDAVAQARLRYSEAVVGYNQAQVNLLAAIGLLDATSIQPLNYSDAAADSATVDS